MVRDKFDYGIDLGTTNSAIACMDSGRLKIIKSDGYQKDTTPSRVQFTRKALRVGDSAKGKSVFVEFKRTMGTDKSYSCEYTDHPVSSEELSAEVLKQLKGYITEENIQAAVITIPMIFEQSQIDATQRAAELAGFQCCELLQEPIAASMAYGMEAETMKGFWLVFDFGGGTFDAALMKIDEGIMKVVDTDGDNLLGGKDIDSAIIGKILIPRLREEYSIDELLADEDLDNDFKRELKAAAETIKIALSSKSKGEGITSYNAEDDEGQEIELDCITVSLEEYESVVVPIFQKAIDIAKGLLERNNIQPDSLGSILLVGGPTFSQTLRGMMREQFKCKIDTSVDPMTSVAKGAALYASTRTIPIDLQQRDSTKIQLMLKYPETTVESEVNLGVMIERGSTSGEVPNVLWLEVARADGGWTSGKVKIEDAEIIEVQLIVGKPNVFDVTMLDERGSQIPCEPSRITIIQGLKAAKAVLQKSICIESVLAESGRQRLVALKGLEKNNTLPSKGKGAFKTQKVIRPGNKEDVLTIPIIHGEPGEQASLNQSAIIGKCSGEELSSLLPEGSDVEITVSIDNSHLITLNAYFPYIDESFETESSKNRDTQQYEVNADLLHTEIKRAHHAVALAEHKDADKLSGDLEDLAQRLDDAGNDYDAKLTISEHLKRILKELDKLEDEAEWPKVKQELQDTLERVKLTNEQYGNTDTTGILDQMEIKAGDVIQQQNVGLATDLTDQLNAMGFALIRQETGLWISYIKGFDEDFDTQQWSDPSAARQFINQAKQIIATQPSRDKLESIVFALFELLPDKEKPIVDPANTELLLK